MVELGLGVRQSESWVPLCPAMPHSKGRLLLEPSIGTAVTVTRLHQSTIQAKNQSILDQQGKKTKAISRNFLAALHKVGFTTHTVFY